MKQLTLFLVSNNLSFKFYHMTNSLVWLKYDKANHNVGEYFFELRDNGEVYYVINNDDVHTFIKIGSINNTIEFIKSINKN